MISGDALFLAGHLASDASQGARAVIGQAVECPVKWRCLGTIYVNQIVLHSIASFEELIDVMYRDAAIWAGNEGFHAGVRCEGWRGDWAWWRRVVIARHNHHLPGRACKLQTRRFTARDHSRTDIPLRLKPTRDYIYRRLALDMSKKGRFQDDFQLSSWTDP
jgi:hypothetical protein